MSALHYRPGQSKNEDLHLLLGLGFIKFATDACPGSEPNSEQQHFCSHFFLQTPAGFSNGSVDRLISRLGDQAAVTVLKLLPNERLEKPKTLGRVLDLFDLAFAYPHLIENPEDLRPIATISLLETIGPDISDQKLNSRVQEELIRFKKQLNSLPTTEPPRGSIEGVVLDKHRKPVPGMLVHAWPLGRPLTGRLQSVSTDSSGSFHLSAEEGLNVVSAYSEAKYYADPVFSLSKGRDQVPTVLVKAGKTTVGVQIRLGPPDSKLRLKIEDENGKPVSEPQITIRRSADPSARETAAASDEGEMELLVPVVEVDIFIRAPGYQDWTTTRYKPVSGQTVIVRAVMHSQSEKQQKQRRNETGPPQRPGLIQLIVP